MQQYNAIKAKYPDAIVFLRDEDEYKIVGADALELARNTTLLIAGELMIDNHCCPDKSRL